jgi:hypothetical protein
MLFAWLDQNLMICLQSLCLSVVFSRSVSLGRRRAKLQVHTILAGSFSIWFREGGDH